MSRYTIADARQHAEKYAAEIKASYEAADLPFRVPKLWEVWQAGCFLNYRLLQHGCSKEEAHQIGFAMGQRSLFGDPWDWAVRYLNEYVDTHAVQDKPGPELAEEINLQFLGAK